MSDAKYILVLTTLVNLIGLWVYWFICRRLHRLDEIRQRLFALRDDAFLYCAENGVPFDHPAYTHLRSSLNATIRYTRNLNWSTLLSLALLPDREVVTRYKVRLETAVQSLPTPEQREKLGEFHMRMHLAVVDYVIHNSIVSIVLWYAMISISFAASVFLKGTRGTDPKAEVSLRAGPVLEADAAKAEKLEPAAA